MLLVVAGGVCVVTASAYALDDVALTRLEQAYLHARGLDAPTRSFVGLFLRVAGIVWIALEWVAAAYLVRGFYLLRGWFEEPRA